LGFDHNDSEIRIGMCPEFSFSGCKLRLGNTPEFLFGGFFDLKGRWSGPRGGLFAAGVIWHIWESGQCGVGEFGLIQAFCTGFLSDFYP
jgi:hypothetical protein